MKNIEIKFLGIAKRSLLCRKIFRTVLRIYKKIKYLRYYFFTEIDENLVLFESFHGKSYSDSPKALYLEMLNNEIYKNYKFVWSFNDPKDKILYFKDLKRTILVRRNSSEYYKCYASAKYWILNSLLNDSIVKKNKQIYVQCWHGTPFKRLGFDLLNYNSNVLNTKKEFEFKYQSDAKKYDYMLSSSKFCSGKLISAFNLKQINKEKVIIEKGYPRNDFLFQYTNNDIENIKKQLNIKSNKKVILYAPTWRDNQHSAEIGYTYKLDIDFDKLQKEIGDKYIILFRAHYFIANSFDFEKYDGFIYDVSNVDDINYLYILSDLLITDYSSCFFDYANLRRPILFFMYDLDEYKNSLRGFYIKLKCLPGPIIKDSKKLLKELKKIDSYWNVYSNKYHKFNRKFNYLDNSNASSRVLRTILERKSDNE